MLSSRPVGNGAPLTKRVLRTFSIQQSSGCKFMGMLEILHPTFSLSCKYFYALYRDEDSQSLNVLIMPPQLVRCTSIHIGFYLLRCFDMPSVNLSSRIYPAINKGYVRVHSPKRHLYKYTLWKRIRSHSLSEH